MNAPDFPVDRLRLADDYACLPCGCEVGSVDDAFVLSPCSLLCDNYLYAVGESKRQGKPPQYRRAL